MLVLKIHRGLPRELPESKIICVDRDPRDVLVSFMQFIKYSFEDSLACARFTTRLVDAYSDYSADYLLMLQACLRRVLSRLATDVQPKLA